MLNFTPLALALAFVSTAARPATLFTISKSENRNEVQYAVLVDEQCSPVGDAPVYGYWRMLERDATSTEPLLWREQRVYGVASQQVIVRGKDGGKVRVTMQALPGRPVLVETTRHGDACVVSSTVTIAGEAAHLENVFAHLKWPFGVDYLLLQGRSIDGLRGVLERLVE